MGQRPCVMVLDPEVIKQVMAKEFNSFMNREVSPDRELGLSLFVVIYNCANVTCSLIEYIHDVSGVKGM